MLTFVEAKAKMKENKNCLDSQLWHACAGGMVQMPKVNAAVYYFPQGHAEHASGNVDFRRTPKIPAYIPCRVSAIKFLADRETDEVFAKIRLVPRIGNDVDFEGNDAVIGTDKLDDQEKPASFAKTLTQSDANNGGGFSVPRYCAETIFPRLDYSADPPVQNILAKDVHGESWKFRHIYRGTPRRHLLTTGWSTFVNHKKLVAGDSVVFLRAENGDLCVGIRRAKRGFGGGPETSSGWNPAGGNCVVPYGGFSAFLREDNNRLISNGNGNNNGSLNRPGRVKPESVLEAATLAENGQPFEVVYYPRASTPEFCVKAPLVKAAMRIRWCAGMRFKMPFETEDSSRISWFMGTISAVQVADAIRWPDSPWRLLQITWDEPDLLQNVKRVNPWLVELVANVPAIHFSAFAPPRKKLRFSQHPDFSHDGQLSFPTFSSNHFLGPSSPFSCLPVDTPAGMQGARHAQYGLPIPNLNPNTLQLGLFPTSFLTLDRAAISSRFTTSPAVGHNPIDPSNDVCCLLTMGNSTESSKKPETEKNAQFVLFGQTIMTEQQIARSSSGDNVSPVRPSDSSSDGNADKTGNTSDGSGSSGDNQNFVPEQIPLEGLNSRSDLETDQCKVL
ncbi:hypothetical protein LIER_37298 [Lithospermum erythrorhizon]|uniref:Auxin response factor n=1 Tax=Lithospermum erythrorhizon TaxID=34254 RepID=A0AAV3PII2_LITER